MFPVVNKEADTETLILKTTKPILAGNNVRLRVQSIFQTPFPSATDTLYMTIWSRRSKIVNGNLRPPAYSTNGGVQNNMVEYKDIYTDEWQYNLIGWVRPIKIIFRNCLAVPKGGEIRLKETDKAASLLTEYSSFETNCRVWHPVQMKVANETHTTCYHEYEAATGNSQWIIKGFDKIEARTIITFDFKAYFAKKDPLQIPYEIGIYHQVGVESSLRDYTINAQNIGATSLSVTLSPYSEVLPFKTFKNDVYKNMEAFIEFDINLCSPSVSCTNQIVDYRYTVEDSYLTIKFRKTSVSSIPTATRAKLYCEWAIYDKTYVTETNYDTIVDGLSTAPLDNFRPFEDWEYDSDATYHIIKLIPHHLWDITVANYYKIRIGTRKDEKEEGITFDQDGTFAYEVISTNQGVLKRRQKNVYTIFGEQIDNFWVYSGNKIRGEDTFIEVFMEWWDATSNGFSGSTYQVNIYFDTKAGTGFQKSLKYPNPYPDLSEYPCSVAGLLANSGIFDHIVCRVNWGYDGAPAKIEVTNFSANSDGNNVIKIRLPFIRNPTHAYSDTVTLGAAGKSATEGGMCYCPNGEEYLIGATGSCAGSGISCTNGTVGACSVSQATQQREVTCATVDTSKATVPLIWAKVVNKSSKAVLWEGHYYVIGNIYRRHSDFDIPGDVGISPPTEQTDSSSSFAHAATTLAGMSNFSMNLRINDPTLNLAAKDYILVQFPNYWPLSTSISTNFC